MTKVAENSAGTISAAGLEQQIRAKIDSLSYLPTTVAVAMKFVELGKDPDAEPAEYAKVISSDSSLSAKLLALVNSSWFAVRNNVAGIPQAVNLLGLGTVRTLATSYCVAGLHNELGLAQDEARLFWEAALCKAVAAKQYVHAMNPKLADQSFVAGLFQDFALPVMYCAAKEELLPILQAPDSDWQTQLQKERTLFRLDHGEIGRILAQKMELPEAFVDAIAFHHNYANLSDFMEDDVIGDAVYVSSLFPHVLSTWSPADAEELRRFLSEHGQSKWTDPNEFLEAVQQEFDQLYRYFEEGNPSEVSLVELMNNATAA
jgi:HD-like signal output (HDOD) protein